MKENIISDCMKREQVKMQKKHKRLLERESDEQIAKKVISNALIISKEHIARVSLSGKIRPDSYIKNQEIINKEDVRCKVKEAKKELEDFIGNSRFVISSKSLKELYAEIEGIFLIKFGSKLI